MRIEDYIKNYLNDNERSILLNGKWGSGKTYFIQNTLIPDLKKENNTDRNILYISLNGVKTIDEVINKIISEKMGLGDKLISGISTLKGILDIGLNIFGLDKIDIKDNNEKLLKLMNFSSDLIIFDDLERISENLSIIDFFGFANTYFIEHNSSKILFVADESKIKSEKYFESKEKIIEHTYCFETNIENIYNEFCDKIIDEPLKTFFNNFKNEILSLLTTYKIDNLRTIFYIFKMFTRIIPIIHTSLDYKNTQSIILFVIIISNEVKNGKIISTDINDKKKLDLINDFRFLRDIISKNDKGAENENKIKEYHEIFFATYLQYQSIKFKFYDSVFKLIINGYIDDETLIYDFRPQDSNSTEWEIAKEIMMRYHDLEESDIYKTVQQVYDFSIQKKYDPLSYGHLYHWLNFFAENRILKIRTAVLKKNLMKALNEIFVENGISADDVARIHYTLTKNTNNPLEVEITRLINLQKKNDKDKAIKEIYDNLDNYKNTFDFFQIYQHSPIFTEININKLSYAIKKSKSTSVNSFHDLLRQRYGFSNIKEFFSTEKENISKLIQSLSIGKINKEKEPIKKLAIKSLIEFLKEIEIKLS